MKQKQECCQEVSSGYLGTTCPKCNKPFRSVIQEPKQEKLEEVAEKWNEKQTTLEFGKPYNAPNRIKAFIEGAKWQQEQDNNKFSEEEIHKIIGSYQAHLTAFNTNFTYNKWFEQFKKK
jgi:hypothetical protein